MWPSHIEHVFIEIMLEEQLKGNMENDVFKQTITTKLNSQTGKALFLRKLYKSTIGSNLNNVSGVNCLNTRVWGGMKAPKQLLVPTRYGHMWLQ